ncbi:DUF4214 domain-containing protein [Methylobacterium sp. WL6]|uniref:DUF4214 domain-containing protein n=1 Tax=Methylobacterium sp. WL6 TaxID=2603901 RepID=UPI0011C70259|nr:DUF4214 domain-containing protein [Methylobacterium sp. WL6]TXN67261.1 DUF4214 domain-containing protein [Methylobacterium sp. WL6]
MASDTTAPVLTGLTLPGTVDLSHGAQTIAITAGASDAGSGVSYVQLRLSSPVQTPDGPQQLVFLHDETDSFSDGLSTYTTTLSPNTAPGTYTIEAAFVFDKAGNSQSYYGTQLADIGAQTSFTVTDQDITAPSLAFTHVSGAINVTTHVVYGFIGKSDADLSIAIQDGANIISTVKSDENGYFEFKLDGGIYSTGHAYNFVATAVDASGNIGSSIPYSYVIDFTENKSLFGSITHDAHSSGGQVYALYEGLLGRAPDTLGLEYWADQFDHGASPANLAAGFLASPEGQARLGASDDAGFVNQLYQNTLGRSGDEGGLSYWTDQLAHGATRVDVADSFVFSSEFTASVQQALVNGLFVPDAQAGDVARLYYTMLDRASDAGGLQYWTGELDHGGSLTSLAQGFLATPENQAKYGSLANSPYVDALYENALGRHADAGGLDFWTHRLDSGVSRADLAVQLSDSPESHTVHLAQIEQGWHLA